MDTYNSGCDIVLMWVERALSIRSENTTVDVPIFVLLAEYLLKNAITLVPTTLLYTVVVTYQLPYEQQTNNEYCCYCHCCYCYYCFRERRCRCCCRLSLRNVEEFANDCVVMSLRFPRRSDASVRKNLVAGTTTIVPVC